MKEPARYMDGPGPDLERQAKLFALLYSTEEVEARKGRIYESLIVQSPQARDRTSG